MTTFRRNKNQTTRLVAVSFACACTLVAGALWAEPVAPEAPAAAAPNGSKLDDPLVVRLRSRVGRVGGLTAEDAARRAVRTSTAARAQAAEVDAADSEVDRAKVAYYPRVSL